MIGELLRIKIFLYIQAISMVLRIHFANAYLDQSKFCGRRKLPECFGDLCRRVQSAQDTTKSTFLLKTRKTPSLSTPFLIDSLTENPSSNGIFCKHTICSYTNKTTTKNQFQLFLRKNRNDFIQQSYLDYLHYGLFYHRLRFVDKSTIDICIFSFSKNY